ncbi:M48 family metalloprotease [Emticicia aquatilis]|uniref:M48 family metalloprotease n=1 Tax=Emticicia aquatilis TaxID=1537369 RepID=UPI001663835A|nr:M48 family metalloprotease [Emticicia aquatilis]
MLSTFVLLANAQEERVKSFGYNYYGQKINERAFCSQFSFRSKEVAEKAVDEIVRRSGLKRNFYVMECPNTDNCFAAIQGQTRLIVYDGSFMKKANDLSKSDWGALSILAHEIGHHLQGHTIIEGGSDPAKELEADEFSGFVMYQMGATLKDAQAAINKLTSDYDGGTHPARPKRLAAIKKGFDNAQELYPNIKKSDGSVVTQPKTQPTQQAPQPQNPTRPNPQPVPQQIPPRTYPQPADNQGNVDRVDNSVDNSEIPAKRPDIIVAAPTNVENIGEVVKKGGCFEGDCSDGFGKMINPKTEEKYEGEWRNGKRDGRGVEFYADGEKKYVGNFKNGKYEGNGTFFYKNGDKYVGKYKNGFMNDDKGYFIFNNNIRLVARVENNIKHGKAMRIYPDGRREDTFFVNDIERKGYIPDKKIR